MHRLFGTLFLALILVACQSSPEDASPSPDAAASAPSPRVFFVEPTDGSTVASPVTFTMGAEGVDIVPAGQQQDNSGHLHILINAPFIDPGVVIPADDQHVHFGTGTTEAELDLPPGTHTIRLQLGDWAHRGLEGDGFRDEITLTVE